MKKLILLLILSFGIISKTNCSLKTKISNIALGTAGSLGIVIGIFNSYKILTDKAYRERGDKAAKNGNIYAGHFLTVMSTLCGSTLLLDALGKLPTSY